MANMYIVMYRLWVHTRSISRNTNGLANANLFSKCTYITRNKLLDRANCYNYCWFFYPIEINYL